MTKEEMLARIQEGAKNQNTPELSPEVVKQIQQQLAARSAQGWNMPVVNKPNPEADANARFSDKNLGLNPPALPSQPSGRIPQSLAPGQAMPNMPEDATEDEQSKMNRLMWLQQKSQTGQ